MRVAKIPKSNIVGQLGGFEEDGDFVGVRAGAMGMQSRGFMLLVILGVVGQVECSGLI